MRGLPIILAGLTALNLLCGVSQASQVAGHVAKETPSAHATPQEEPSACPISDPEGKPVRQASDLDSVKAEPGVATWNGCTLTILSNGEPVATFTDLALDGAWHFIRSVELTEKDARQRRAYLLWFSTYETNCQVLLDPDGRLHVVSFESFKPVFLPGGRLIASGMLGSGVSDADGFMIIDWPERKAYISRAGCQVVDAKTEDALNLACWHRTDKDDGYYADARRRPDGRWQITPTAGFQGYLIPQYLADRPKTTPAALKPSDRPTTLESSPIPDDTDRFAWMGFVWLGRVSVP